MTLDEAIQHCEEKAQCGTACGMEHKQLAEWLRELKVFRKLFKNYEKEHEMKVTFEGAESEEGEQVFTLPDQLHELIENVHNYAVHNCDFKVNGKYYGSI